MVSETNEGGVTGGSYTPAFPPAPKGKRLACACIDLFGVPVVLGIIFGVILLAIQVPDWLNTVGLISVNVTWMIFRDFKWSPGRKWLGLKLVSLKGDQSVTLQQAFLRNALVIFPGLLLIGYPVEIISIFFVKGDRLMDSVAKTRVITAA